MMIRPVSREGTPSYTHVYAQAYAHVYMHVHTLKPKAMSGYTQLCAWMPLLTPSPKCACTPRNSICKNQSAYRP